MFLRHLRPQRMGARLMSLGSSFVSTFLGLWPNGP